jgi:hypothetical protein
MPEFQSIRHVPWTCKWGRFGGPVDNPAVPAQGFVFWTCGHPEIGDVQAALARGSCENCPKWEPVEPST